MKQYVAYYRAIKGFPIEKQKQVILSTIDKKGRLVREFVSAKSVNKGSMQHDIDMFNKAASWAFRQGIGNLVCVEFSSLRIYVPCYCTSVRL